MGPFQQAQTYMGNAGGGIPNFSMGQNSLYAQKVLQNSLLGLNQQRSNLGLQFGQQEFNTQHQPGVLGALSAGVNGLGALNDIMGYGRMQNFLKKQPLPPLPSWASGQNPNLALPPPLPNTYGPAY